MGEVTVIGVDLAKNVFQVHGAAADGSVLFRKKLSRPQFARFMADQPPCLVAMEACASAHHWRDSLQVDDVRCRHACPAWRWAQLCTRRLLRLSAAENAKR